MNNYLLDTHACLALIRGNPHQVRTRLQRALRTGSLVFSSSLVMFDLWERVAESAEPRHRIIEAFLAGPVSILAFDEEDAKAATQIRAELDAKSGKVEPLGLLVAGQAQAKRLVLATAGVKWPRVKGLLCRDWAV